MAKDTVDGWNPAPPGMYETLYGIPPLSTGAGFQPSTVPCMPKNTHPESLISRPSRPKLAVKSGHLEFAGQDPLKDLANHLGLENHPNRTGWRTPHGFVSWFCNKVVNPHILLQWSATQFEGFTQNPTPEALWFQPFKPQEHVNLFGKTGSDEKTSSRHLVEIEAMEDSSFDLSFTWRKYTFPNTSVINKQNNKPISVSILYMIHRSFHQDRLIMTSTFLYLYIFLLFLPRLLLFLSFNFWNKKSCATSTTPFSTQNHPSLTSRASKWWVATRSLRSLMPSASRRYFKRTGKKECGRIFCSGTSGIAILEHTTTFLVVGFGVFVFLEITRVKQKHLEKHDLSIELQDPRLKLHHFRSWIAPLPVSGPFLASCNRGGRSGPSPWENISSAYWVRTLGAWIFFHESIYMSICI